MLVRNECILCRQCQCKQYRKQKSDIVAIRFHTVSKYLFAKDFITKHLFNITSDRDVYNELL